MENLEDVKQGALKCLQYFGLFKHPLTPEEVFRYITVKSSHKTVQVCLNKLVTEGSAFHFAGYYSNLNEPSWILRRAEGQSRAFKLLEKTSVYVSIIASFPFVKGIAISGSLSKFYTGENGDIDYFIITDRNKLWITRTLLHLFKKFTFLTGHQHYFCMNYFVDMQALMIAHQNLYTAIEIHTMLPVYNEALIHEIKQKNSWTETFLPNDKTTSSNDYIVQERFSKLKSLSELLLRFLFPSKLNLLFMNLTKWKWKRKWRNHHYSLQDYNNAFLSTPHISKNHPVNYEKKVLSALNSKVSHSYIKAE